MINEHQEVALAQGRNNLKNWQGVAQSLGKLHQIMGTLEVPEEGLPLTSGATDAERNKGEPIPGPVIRISNARQ